MELIINYIIELGYKPWLTVPLVGGLWVFKNYREELLIAWNVRGFSAKRNLKLHTLFLTTYEMKSSKINEVRIEEDRLKEKCLRIFLKHKVSAIENMSYKLIEDKVYKQSNEKFLRAIKMNLSQILEEYNRKTKASYLEMGMSQDEISTILTKWNNVHKTLIESLEDEISDVLLNPQYGSNYMKLIVILNLYSMALKNTFDSGIEHFISLNGFFKRLKLKV